METKELLKKFMAGSLGMGYNGRALSSTPSNMTMEQVVECLRTHHPFTVVLEPGDVTRYVLTFLPLDGSGMQHHGYNAGELMDCWLVCRNDGAGFVGVVANAQWDFAHHNLGDLHRGNEHTGDLFVTWLSLAFSACRSAEDLAEDAAVAGHGS